MYSDLIQGSIWLVTLVVVLASLMEPSHILAISVLSISQENTIEMLMNVNVVFHRQMNQFTHTCVNFVGRFLTTNSFVRHEKRHNTKYQCTACLKEFSSTLSMQKHHCFCPKQNSKKTLIKPKFHCLYCM